MKTFLNYITQASTWEGIATGVLTVATAMDAVATGGAVSGLIAVTGAIASTTSIMRDDRKQG